MLQTMLLSLAVLFMHRWCSAFLIWGTSPTQHITRVRLRKDAFLTSKAWESSHSRLGCTNNGGDGGIGKFVTSAVVVAAITALAPARHGVGRTQRKVDRSRIVLGATPPLGLGKFVKRPSEYPDECPEPGDLVRIHYVGTLEDGTVFDSSRARGKPFEFNIGESQVIDGWDILIGTMALGERADLVIPPEYAYGDAGMPPVVPPNATLVFDVEILDIGKPIEDDSDGEDNDQNDNNSYQADQGLTREETLLDDDGKLFWEKDPERERGQGPGYVWNATGTGAEICISVPLNEGVKVKEINVGIRTNSVTCKIGNNVVVDGELFASVDSDDSHWDLERKDRAINLLIYLAKLDTHLKWKSLLKCTDSPEAEIVDVDAALRVANEQSRRRTDAHLM